MLQLHLEELFELDGPRAINVRAAEEVVDLGIAQRAVSRGGDLPHQRRDGGDGIGAGRPSGPCWITPVGKYAMVAPAAAMCGSGAGASVGGGVQSVRRCAPRAHHVSPPAREREWRIRRRALKKAASHCGGHGQFTADCSCTSTSFRVCWRARPHLRHGLLEPPQLHFLLHSR